MTKNEKERLLRIANAMLPVIEKHGDFIGKMRDKAERAYERYAEGSDASERAELEAIMLEDIDEAFISLQERMEEVVEMYGEDGENG